MALRGLTTRLKIAYMKWKLTWEEEYMRALAKAIWKYAKRNKLWYIAKLGTCRKNGKHLVCTNDIGFYYIRVVLDRKTGAITIYYNGKSVVSGKTPLDFLHSIKDKKEAERLYYTLKKLEKDGFPELIALFRKARRLHNKEYIKIKDMLEEKYGVAIIQTTTVNRKHRRRRRRR